MPPPCSPAGPARALAVCIAAAGLLAAAGHGAVTDHDADSAARAHRDAPAPADRHRPVPVLVFHAFSVDEVKRQYSTPLSRFRAWLDAFRSAGYRLVDARRHLVGRALPAAGRFFAVTFDDGWSTHRLAWDTLAAYCAAHPGFALEPGTVPVTLAVSFDKRVLGSLFSYGAFLERVIARGGSVASHGLRHAPADRLGPGEFIEEIAFAQFILARTVRNLPSDFICAPPYGTFPKGWHGQGGRRFSLYGYGCRLIGALGVATDPARLLCPHPATRAFDPLAVPRIDTAFHEPKTLLRRLAAAR